MIEYHALTVDVKENSQGRTEVLETGSRVAGVNSPQQGDGWPLEIFVETVLGLSVVHARGRICYEVDLIGFTHDIFHPFGCSVHRTNG